MDSRRWDVTIWKRVGKSDRKQPANYSVVGTCVVECEDPKVAASEAALKFKLHAREWTGGPRPAYIVRVNGVLP